MKSSVLILICVVLFAFAATQDVSVPNDLLGTTQNPSNATDFEYSDEETSEETTEGTTEEVTEETTEPDLSWNGGFDDNATLPPPGSLIRPPFPVPPYQSNCTILLPPSTHPPIIIPPIMNSTTDPIEREETVVCPVGSIQVGSSCNVTYSNECPQGYKFNGERCVIKITNCPLNFELNEFGRCVQRQICPHNHVWENGRCKPVTQCPHGWNWNGERCEVANIQCQPGSILRGNECVVETFTCPIGFDQDGDECREPPLVCPPGFEMKSDGFCSQVTLRCPPGSFMTNGECRRTTFSCPKGTYKVGSQCFKIRTEEPTCPPGFYLHANMCYLIPTERPATEQPDIICPPGTYRVGNACYLNPSTTKRPTIDCPPGTVQVGNACQLIPTTTTSRPVVDCPPGTFKIGNVCHLIQSTTTEPSVIECPPGTVQIGNACHLIPATTTTPPIECPPGTMKVGDACQLIPSTTTKRPTLNCPPGTVKIGSDCYLIPVTDQCPTGFYKDGKRCIQNPTPSPPLEINSTERPTVDCPVGYYRMGRECIPYIFPQPTTPRTVGPQCPDGFILSNNQCYRCPPSFDLCENKCVKNTVGCGNANYPNININIYARDSRATGKGYNIINQFDPINNTIVNINNVTHPVTLNNVNENNIYIYSDAQCPDGSIRTVVVKNNETINGCVDVVGTDKQPDASNPSDINEGDENENENSEKCCEIVTPRQCKKRGSNQWICSHRRYQYCGKFCIADRLYLKPPSTTYKNQILTILPSQPVHNAPPCFGRNCPPVDCSGCIDGSFNCSYECYTYPCNHAGCHYLNQEDFCSIVGGQICEPVR